LQLVNLGTVDVEAGSINFSAFTHSLANGSRLTGPGAVQVNGATVNLDGTVACATPFSLVSGALGGSGTFQGDLNWSGGAIAGTLALKGNSTWTGGTLSGQLTVPVSSALTITSNATKTISGLLRNDGQVTVLDKTVLTLAAAAPVVNTGTFEIQYDKPFLATV